MHILVGYASKHGSTREIAEAIGMALAKAGHTVAVLDVTAVHDVLAYDAVVLGSAVYAGRWSKPARDFVNRHGQALAARPTWLFSSGPVGDPPKPTPEQAVEIGQYMLQTGAKEHRLFAGKLDRQALSFPERALVAALHAPVGDFRDWRAIDDWAVRIAASLAAAAR